MTGRTHCRSDAASTCRVALSLLLLCGILHSGCDQITGSIPRGSTEKNNLASMAASQVRFGDLTYNVWLARSPQEQQLGLMNTTEAELPADRGMLFVFDYDRYQSFWMRNTIIPLDIAYIRSDGTVVKTYTMTPLDETGYPSLEPARFVLEVRAGQFAEHGVKEGDRAEIPADLLN